MSAGNPLFDDRDIEFQLFDVFAADALCKLPFFSEHSRQTFELLLKATRKLARDVVFPSYKPMDEHAAHFDGKHVVTHPMMRELYPQIAELGVINAARPNAVEGQQLPTTVASVANAYLMAANSSAFGYTMLTAGAAHLIEAFGDDALKHDYMTPMYAGRWSGTMALTEPQAGSSLADVQCKATAHADGHYSIQGSKVFISGGDQTVTENIVHLALARIAGAPAGTKGISLFVVPKLRTQDGKLIDNDCKAAGAFHKLGWRGLPSIALNFGEEGNCHGYLVGKPHHGLPYMFQMMNEARINIGIQGVATASVAYQESLEYARSRPQGRGVGARPESAPVPIIEHADVRRMLLRQKAIVEGGVALILATSRYQDLSQHAPTQPERTRAQLLLDLLTPITKSFPAEKGYESNVLAVQIHGGYGYTSEYLPEAWLRDQKLNSIHEGTTGIQSLDLLGRKVLRSDGAALVALSEEIDVALQRAAQAALDPELCTAVRDATRSVLELSRELATRARTEPEAALWHSADYLDLASTWVVGYLWLLQAAVAQEKLTSGAGDRDFLEGKLAAARYFIRTELPRVTQLAALCRSGEDSYARMSPDWF